MIYHVTIDSKDYPFLFGYRVMYQVGRASIVGEGVDNRGAVNMEVDNFLTILAMANKRGAEKQCTPELVLTAEQFEDILDEDLEVAEKLNAIFVEAMASKHMKGGEQGKPKPTPRRKKK